MLFRVVPVQKVRVVGVCLELADGAIVAVYSAQVGQRCRAACLPCVRIRVALGVSLVGVGVLHVVIARRPLAEHARLVAGFLEQLGDDLVGVLIGFLSNDIIVGVLPECVLPKASLPILAVAPDMDVARVLAGHEAGTRRSADGTAGIGLCEAHALCCHAVEVGGGDELLPVAAKVAISHVVAHDIDDVGALVRHCRCGEASEQKEQDVGTGFHDFCRVKCVFLFLCQAKIRELHFTGK